MLFLNSLAKPILFRSISHQYDGKTLRVHPFRCIQQHVQTVGQRVATSITDQESPLLFQLFNQLLMFRREFFGLFPIFQNNAVGYIVEFFGGQSVFDAVFRGFREHGNHSVAVAVGVILRPLHHADERMARTVAAQFHRRQRPEIMNFVYHLRPIVAGDFFCNVIIQWISR